MPGGEFENIFYITRAWHAVLGIIFFSHFRCVVYSDGPTEYIFIKNRKFLFVLLWRYFNSLTSGWDCFFACWRTKRINKIYVLIFENRVFFAGTENYIYDRNIKLNYHYFNGRNLYGRKYDLDLQRLPMIGPGHTVINYRNTTQQWTV